MSNGLSPGRSPRAITNSSGSFLRTQMRARSLLGSVSVIHGLSAYFAAESSDLPESFV